MDSRSQSTPDSTSFSSLPNSLLIMIITNLAFKDALKTSAISKRWKNLYREMTKISFKESEIISLSDPNDEDTKRAAFIHYVVNWVSKFRGNVIETFELCLSKPVSIESINYLVEFVVSKKVKNLVLDFSDRSWIFSDDAEAEEASLIQLPECFYSLTSLESLNLSFCGFDASKLVHARSIKNLCFRWMPLINLTSLISKAPLLETLRIKTCWNVGLEAITEYNRRLTTLVFKNSNFAVNCTTLELPTIQVFKYSGKIHYFEFGKVNRIMEEAYLDFSEECQFDDETGTQLSNLLYDLLSARTLLVCPFLIQMIKDAEDPVRLKAPMETKQLILKTSLYPEEFVGIRLLLNSSPYLEVLSFHIVLHRPHDMVEPPFDPDTYWSHDIEHKCLKKSLKFLEFWNFSGDKYELHLLMYLFRYGRVLERVDLYLPDGVSETNRVKARAAAQIVGTRFERASKRLRIYLHDG